MRVGNGVLDDCYGATRRRACYANALQRRACSIPPRSLRAQNVWCQEARVVRGRDVARGFSSVARSVPNLTVQLPSVAGCDIFPAALLEGDHNEQPAPMAGRDPKAEPATET